MQPMFAKIILPVLGGAPAVWNTCVLFFQTTLFAGLFVRAPDRAMARGAPPGGDASCADGDPALAASRRRLAVWTPPSTDNPAPWLLGRMLISVGPPFFVVAASPPL